MTLGGDALHGARAGGARAQGRVQEPVEELRAEGFTRAKIDGELRRLEEEIELDKKYKHDIAVVVDRLLMRPDVRKRLADSVETAVALAEGIVEIEDADTGEVKTFSEKFACLHCGTSMPELEPRMFSFNSPHGACPRCTGLGSQMEIDPELVVPDPSLSLAEGAILPWSTSASNYYDQMTQAIGEQYEIDLDTPWEDLAEDAQDCFLFGTNGDRIYVSYRNRYGRRRSYMTSFEGIVPNLERRYQETDSEYVREKIEEYMSVVPCPECEGARLRPESLAVKVGGIGIHEVTRMSARRAIEWFDAARADGHRAADRAPDPERDRRAAALPRQRRRRLPDPGAGGGHALGRRGAADPARDADRVEPRGRALHPRRAVDRAAPARQHAADPHARAAARPRQHGDRRRARRGHDAGRRPPRRPRAGRGRARRPAGRGGHARGGHADLATRSPASTWRGSGRSRCRRSAGGPSGYIEIERAAQHNLKKIDVKFPLGVFCASPGVSGSGKSTLVNEILHKAVANRLHRAKQRPGTHRQVTGLDQIDKIINIDQSPIGRTPRSNPATYIGLFDPIRELYSQTQEAARAATSPAASPST